MVKVVVYRKTFPSALINMLVNCGYRVKVEYSGRDMAEPYRVEFMFGRSDGYRFILQDNP